MPYFIAFALLMSAGLINMWSRAEEQGRAIVFKPEPLPAKMAGWVSVRRVAANKDVHRMLQEDAMQWHTYRQGDSWADLLVLYGHRKRTFHLPDSCLAGAGITIKSRQMVVLTMPNGALVPFHALMLQKDDCSAIALYTFIGPDGSPTDLLGLNLGMLACRIRGNGPKGAAIRVIGPIDPSKPIASQPICELAAIALKEVGKRVATAGPASHSKEHARRMETTSRLERSHTWHKS